VSETWEVAMRHRLSLVGVLLALGLVVSACDWPSFGYDSSGSRSSGDNTISVSNVGGFTGMVLKWSRGTGGPIESSPAISQNVAYVGSDDGKVYAWNATSGNGLWASATTGGAVHSSPAVVNGLVYVGSDVNSQTFFSALNAADGSPSWTD